VSESSEKLELKIPPSRPHPPPYTKIWKIGQKNNNNSIKKKKKDILLELQEKKYDLFLNDDKEKNEESESSETEETNESSTIAKLSNGYNYLLSMQI